MKPGSVDILVTLYNLDLDSLSTGTEPMKLRDLRYLWGIMNHTPYFLSCLHNTIGLHPNTAQQMSSLCNWLTTTNSNSKYFFHQIILKRFDKIFLCLMSNYFLKLQMQCDVGKNRVFSSLWGSSELKNVSI